MNSTNIWKKRLNRLEKRKSNKIVNDIHFKSKKKKIFSNFLKRNLITNWIKNEENELIIDLNINEQEEDKDSLELDHIQYLSEMKNILFLDLENFSSFFQHLTNHLPNQTYLIAFQGSNISWKTPTKYLNFNLFKRNQI